MPQELEDSLETENLRDEDGRQNMTKLRERFQRISRAKDGTPLYFTKENVTQAFGPFEARKIDVFEKMELAYNKEQVLFKY